jgi:hypothetical protein
MNGISIVCLGLKGVDTFGFPASARNYCGRPLPACDSPSFGIFSVTGILGESHGHQNRG